MTAIAQLEENRTVEGVYAVAKKERLRTKNGAAYLALELVERWLAGDIDVAPFVSHRISLDDVNRGFELMERQDGIRSVIEF